MTAITNFGTLKSELLALLGRAPADPVYQMVTGDINHELRLMLMEATSTLTGAASITLPADFLAVESVYLDQSPRIALRPVPAQALHRQYITSGTPEEYAIVDGKMLINPVGTGDIELRYFARQDALSADEDTNDILTYHPDVYVYGALYHHSLLTQDTDKVGGYEKAYELAKRKARASDAQDRVSGAPMTPVVHGMTP